MRSPEEILRQTNELARCFYGVMGNIVPDGYDFRLATHPQERQMWLMACEAQLVLTETDIHDVLDELEIE